MFGELLILVMLGFLGFWGLKILSTFLPDISHSKSAKRGITSETAEKLKDAKELLDKGIITEEEFQEMKKEQL